MLHRRSNSEKARKKYKITNWREYNQALKQRGSLTVWISGDLKEEWYAKADKFRKRGRQSKYSDLAIEAMLTLRSLFKLPLRQIEGLCNSLFELGSIKLEVPEFSRLSRRGAKALSRLRLPSLQEPCHIIIDSTGLKVYGESEWLENKHGKQYKRKLWRKLHISLNKEDTVLRINKFFQEFYITFILLYLMYY